MKLYHPVFGIGIVEDVTVHPDGKSLVYFKNRWLEADSLGPIPKE